MSDDPTLDALGELVREEAKEVSDERIEALARGELSAAEARALAQEAPELFEAFRPIEPEHKDALAERALALLDTQNNVPRDPSQPNDPSQPEAPAAEVVHLSWRRFARQIAAVATIAAGLLAFVMLRPDPWMLPAYELTVVGGDQTLRSAGIEPTQLRTFTPESYVSFWLQPATDAPGAVSVLLGRVVDGALIPADIKAETSTAGAVRVHGPAGRIFGPEPGEKTLLLAIGAEPLTVRQVWRDGKLRPRAANDRWRAFVVQARIKPAP